MSSVAVDGLTLEGLAAMLASVGGPDALRDAFVADQAYRNTPIGHLAGRYLDALRFEEYADSTISNREQTLAWLAFDHPTLPPEQVTHELLRAFLEQHWKDAAANTKAQHVSGLRCFFAWAHDNDHLPANPARKLRPPRRNETERRSHPASVIRKLVVAQDSRRDRVAILLLYWCGLRRNELRLIQFRHIDLNSRILTVFGKGARVLPQSIPEPLALELERHIQDRQADPDEYLLYPQKRGRRRIEDGGYTTGVIWENRLHPLSPHAMHDWWKRMLALAGLPATRKMHEMRHTAATDMLRSSGNLELTRQMLGHADIKTTAMYTHLDMDDLAEALRLLAEKRAQDAAEAGE